MRNKDVITRGIQDVRKYGAPHSGSPLVNPFTRTGGGYGVGYDTFSLSTTDEPNPFVLTIGTSDLTTDEYSAIVYYFAFGSTLAINGSCSITSGLNTAGQLYLNWTPSQRSYKTYAILPPFSAHLQINGSDYITLAGEFDLVENSYTGADGLYHMTLYNGSDISTLSSATGSLAFSCCTQIMP